MYILLVEAEIKMVETTTSSERAIDVQLDNASATILNQNNPTPFGEHATITYNIPDDLKEAKIIFFNNLGRIFENFCSFRKWCSTTECKCLQP